MGNNFKSFLRLKLLSSIEGIGLKTINVLLSEFKTIDALINAGTGRIMSVPELTPLAAKKISNFNFENKQLVAAYTDLYEKTLSLGINIVTYYCNNYPAQLKNIYDPPLVLYTLGNYDLDYSNSVSIVGTRNNTVYGKIQTEQITKELVANNITIISGMAKGIDTIAHKTALQYSGNTAAVIGSGLDIIYPSENKKLFADIKNNGLIISEFDLGAKPDAGNFPKRNRIISALSLGTVVIETRKKGGALHTANLALEQGKEVFAVPGNIGSINSEGTNQLIQNGSAKLVTNAKDILVEIDSSYKEKKSVSPKPEIALSLFEQKIFDTFEFDFQHIDKIAATTGLSVQDCLTNLLLLEMKGLVTQLPGKNFRKTSNV